MASPFRKFRKHQKVLIVWATVFLMFAFVLGGVLSSYTGPATRREDPVVLSSDYGTFRASDLHRMRRMQGIVNQFLVRAAQARMEIEQQRPTSTWWLSFEEMPPARSVLEIMLLARKAEEVGMRVSNDEVNRFLMTEVAGTKIPDEQLRNLLAGYQIGERRVSMNHIFDVLREMLLAQRLREVYGVATAVTPWQRWQKFLQLNERIKLDLLPLPVANYLDQVEDPTEIELKEFFAKYKDKLSEVDVIDGVEMQSPEPGFKIPRQGVFQYIKADYEKFHEKVAEEITEQQVRDYYERRKDIDYVQVGLLGGEEAPEQDKTEQPAEGTPPEPEQATTEEKQDGSPAEPAEAAKPAAEKKAADQQPAKTSAEEPAGGEAEKKPEKAAGSDEPAEPASPSSSPKASSKSAPQPQGNQPAPKVNPADGAALPAAAPVRLVAFEPPAKEPAKKDATQKSQATQKSKDTEKSPQPPAAKNDSDVSAVAAGNKKAAAQAKKPAASEEPADGEAKEKSAAPAEGSAPEKPADETALPAGTEPAETEPAETEKTEADTGEGEEPKQYIPFEEVKDEIRQKLADQETTARMMALLEPLERKLSLHSQKLAARREEESLEPNLPSDLKQQVEQAGLEFETTELISQRELADLAVGTAEVQEVPSAPGGTPFAEFAFANDLRPYKPYAVQDFAGDRYLVWKVGGTEAKVPELEEVREQVVRAWKMRQARTLAKEAAEKMAEEAEQSGASLAALFDNQKIITTDFFSWLSDDVVPRPGSPRVKLSLVTGVAGADHDFMEQVFSLEKGETTTVTNHAETVVYVAELVDRESTKEELRQRFINSETSRFQPWNMLARQEIAVEVGQAILESLEAEANVQWVRDPLDESAPE